MSSTNLVNLIKSSDNPSRLVFKPLKSFLASFPTTDMHEYPLPTADCRTNTHRTRSMKALTKRNVPKNSKAQPARTLTNKAHPDTNLHVNESPGRSPQVLKRCNLTLLDRSPNALPYSCRAGSTTLPHVPQAFATHWRRHYHSGDRMQGRYHEVGCERYETFVC